MYDSPVYQQLLATLESKPATIDGKTAVFFTGRQEAGDSHVSNEKLALQWAKDHPGSYTLYDTEAGGYLKVAEKALKAGVIAPEEYDNLGIVASQMMAQQARGNAVAFVKGSIRDASTFTNYELPTMLGNNPAVSAVNGVPAATLDTLSRGDPHENWMTLTETLGAKTPPLLDAEALVNRLGRVTGPAALGLGTVLQGGIQGYVAYHDGKSAPAVAAATLAGANDGLVDTVLPGARSGYSDVTGTGKQMTGLDRALNLASDSTGSATVVSGGAALAGVETGPLDLAPAAISGLSGLANVGVNLAKAGVKVTGFAGKDQDGGYIYDGVAATYELGALGVRKLDAFITGIDDEQPSGAPKPVFPSAPLQPAGAKGAERNG